MGLMTFWKSASKVVDAMVVVTASLNEPFMLGNRIGKLGLLGNEKPDKEEEDLADLLLFFLCWMANFSWYL